MANADARPSSAPASPAVTNSIADPATGAGGQTAAVPPPAPPAGTARYALAEEIARGGMGVIYRATDLALGREVAVKVLREKYDPDSDAARRFEDEARITAQLQHPAIPPVHDLGTLPDGRPFLAMKLIKGATLDRLLEDRSDPSAERGRFIAVFEQVCQALAYAHSHRVIHRDLKPGNVMVGAFGEVQVMDWGLAKVLAERPVEAADPEETTAASVVISMRDSDGSFTQAGSVLGTPAYMPPEQALGTVGKVDARSDVFGLGAILAVILTGEPPFAAGSAETVRVLSAQGRLDECFTRLGGCGADPELVALCKRCLSPSPSDRPDDAGQVAKAVADLRTAADERARRAELERVKAEGEKAAAQLQAAEQRKRRRVQLALFAAVGLLFLGGAAFAWWYSVQVQTVRDRYARNAEAVKGLLDQCEEALRGGDAARAEITLGAAKKRAAEGGAEASAGRLGALADDLALLRYLDGIDRFNWTWLGKEFPANQAAATRYHAALGGFGADPDAAGPEASAARASGCAVRERLLAALDRLLLMEKSAAVRAALQRVDPDPFRDAVRDAVRGNDRAAVVKLVGQADALDQPPWFAALLGWQMIGAPAERRQDLLVAVVQRHPSRLDLLMSLGCSYPHRREAIEERVRWFQAAVAVAPDNFAAHINLGGALRDKKDLDGAMAQYKEALRIDPRSAMAHDNLGNVLLDKGDVDGALAEQREAVRLDPQDVLSHTNLGTALLRKDLKAAIAQYHEALRLDSSHAGAHGGLADALYMSGDKEGAMAETQEALRLDSQSVLGHKHLAILLDEKGELDKAIESLRTAVRLDPKFADSHYSLGVMLEKRGDLDGAIACYREALRLEPPSGPAASALGRAEHKRTRLVRSLDTPAGKPTPAGPAEALALAQVCKESSVKRYAGAASLYADAFAADSQLTDDLHADYRYSAACCATRAAGGEGIEAPTDQTARTALRKEGLGWLRADLELHRNLAASPDAAERGDAAAKLAHWLEDTDLSGVRDPEALAKVPAGEREQWEKLWADVKATLADAQKPAPPAGTESGNK